MATLRGRDYAETWRRPIRKLASALDRRRAASSSRRPCACVPPSRSSASAFICEDTDAWGTLTERDDPLYDEECVELFLAPGEADPADYFEFEVSPLGTLFDAKIHNPTGRRETMAADVRWNALAQQARPLSRRI